MRSSQRSLRLPLLGALALVAAGWMWFTDGPGIPPESNRMPKVPDDPAIEVVPIEESSRWLERLSSGGEIRIRVGEKETPASRTLPNVGGLDASERAYVEECLRARVDVFSRQFEEHYAQTAWETEEWRRLEEMRVNAALNRYKAYDLAFVNGEYFVLPATESAPDLGPTVACLNMGGTCAGTPVKVVVVADKKKYQIDVMEREYEARRRDWLSRRVADFNALPLEQREAAILRLNANKPEDAVWRDATFPRGLRVNDTEKTISL